MTISINSKRLPHQGTFNRRLTPAGPLLAVFAASLLLTACPSPDGGTDTNPSGGGTTAENNCTGTDRYSITRKSANSYKLTVKECVREIESHEFRVSSDLREPLTIIEKEAEAKDVVANQMITEIVLPSTLRSIGESGLAGHTRMSGTLTIPRNVQTLARRAFRAMASDIKVPPAVVVFEPGSKLKSIGTNAFFQSRLKDFTLPENLETIESYAFLEAVFLFSGGLPGTLIIPSKVHMIGSFAFSSSTGITAVDIRSDLLEKPEGKGRSPLRNNLFRNAKTKITEIKMPRKVYNKYNKKDLKKIFGDDVNYLKPDGTAY